MGGYDEVVLLNERGEVAECTAANIFCVSEGRVLTPPLSSGCLEGVTRGVVLDIGAAGGRGGGRAHAAASGSLFGRRSIYFVDQSQFDCGERNQRAHDRYDAAAGDAETSGGVCRVRSRVRGSARGCGRQTLTGLRLLGGSLVTSR